MSDTAPNLEFVDDPVEITTTTTLRQAKENLGMSVTLGWRVDRFIVRIREQFDARSPLAVDSW